MVKEKDSIEDINKAPRANGRPFVSYGVVAEGLPAARSRCGVSGTRRTAIIAGRMGPAGRSRRRRAFELKALLLRARPPVKRLLRIKRVLEPVPVSRSQLYNLTAAGNFPKPIHAGGGQAAF